MAFKKSEVDGRIDELVRSVKLSVFQRCDKEKWWEMHQKIIHNAKRGTEI